MYTEKSNNNVGFDWDGYFKNLNERENDRWDIDYKSEYLRIKKLTSENPNLLSMGLNNILRSMLKNQNVKTQPSILELGAGTGFLTRVLINKYNGKGTLVDNCKTSYEAYLNLKENNSNIRYLQEDVFKLDLTEKFDIVCSFGLIEHFADKKDILAVHKKFLNENGVMIIAVPMDSMLTRLYYEMHPELNLGYRELMKKKDILKVLEENDIKPISIEKSINYVYDFFTVLCHA